MQFELQNKKNDTHPMFSFKEKIYTREEYNKNKLHIYIYKYIAKACAFKKYQNVHRNRKFAQTSII